MSYEEKVAKAHELIEGYNASIAEDKGINWETFKANLIGIGGTSEEALKGCAWEDLEDCGLPKLLAKQIATVFRGRDERMPIVTVARASAMTVTELVERYDPRDADNAVGARLKLITNGKRCVIFNADNSVNTSVTAELVNAIKDGYPERDAYLLDGDAVIVHRIGDRPDLLFDENPLCQGEILQPNGDCTTYSGLNWSGVSQEAKVLVYLAVRDTKEVVVRSADDAHRVHELASSAVAVTRLRQRYVKAAIRYAELAKTNQLPVLKVVRGASRKHDPFGGGNRTY